MRKQRIGTRVSHPWGTGVIAKLANGTRAVKTTICCQQCVKAEKTVYVTGWLNYILNPRTGKATGYNFRDHVYVCPKCQKKEALVC